MNDQIDGIIVDVREYRENDAMLHVLSEDGQLFSMVARGIQKIKSKNAPACQLFSFSRMQLNVREQVTLQSLRTAEILQSYRSIREDLLKQSIASYFCECIYKSDFEENVFELLKQSLDILKATSHPLCILCLFQSIMNRMHGIESYVDGCVRCGNEHNIYAISMISGGFVCRQCYQAGHDKIKSAQELKRFRLLCKAELQHYEIVKNYTDFSFQDFDELYAFFAEYGGITLKSYKFLRHLSQMEEDFK